MLATIVALLGLALVLLALALAWVPLAVLFAGFLLLRVAAVLEAPDRVLK